MSWNKVLFIFLLVGWSCSSDDPNAEQVPLPPTNLTAVAVSESQINLSWTDNSTNEKGFKIERKISPDSYLEIASVGADKTTYIDLGLTSNTTYSYRVYSFNNGGKSLTYSNEDAATTNGLPTLSTTTITLITNNSASSGGTISDNGGSSVIERGIVWGTNPNPTVFLTTKTSNGIGVGGYESELENLDPNTTYFVRAYGTNTSGTGYGNEVSFTTDDTSEEEMQLNKLKANVWNLSSAELGTTDRTTDFANLKLTITGTYVAGGTYGYSFTGTRPNPSPWPANGTWKFGSNINTQIIRLDDDPDLGMNYALTDTKLTITFTYTGVGFVGGRVEQVSGDWEFIFLKQ